MSKKHKMEMYDGPVSTDADIEAMVASMVSSGEISTGKKGAVVAAPEEVFVPKQKHHGKHNDVMDAIASAVSYAATSMSETGKKNTHDVSETAPIPPEVIARVKASAPPIPTPSDIKADLAWDFGNLVIRSGSNRYGRGITFSDNFHNSITTQIYPKSDETAALDAIEDGDLGQMLINIYILLKLETYPDCICTAENIAASIKDINADNIVVIMQNDKYFVYLLDYGYIDKTFVPKFTGIAEKNNGSVVGTVITLLNTFNEVPTLREFVTSDEDAANSVSSFVVKARDLFPADEPTELDKVEYNIDTLWESCYSEIYSTISVLQQNGAQPVEPTYAGVPENIYGDFSEDVANEESEDEDDADEEYEEETGVSNDTDSFRSESNGTTENVSANTESVGDTSGADEVQTDFEPFAEEVPSSSDNNDTESDDNQGRLTTPLGAVLKNAGITGGSIKAEQPSGSTVVKETQEVKAQEAPQQKEVGRSVVNQKVEEKKKVDPFDDMVINIQTVGRK